MAPPGSELHSTLVLLLPLTAAAGTYLLWRNGGSITNFVYKLVARSNPHKAGQGYLKGNYAPVKDEIGPVGPLKVEHGAIPQELNGVYIRTGPNPAFTPTNGYHWFDGDGMLHAVRLKDGQAVFSNRYVETSRLKQERAKGEASFLKLGDLMGMRGLALVLIESVRRWFGYLDLSKGAGTANTALVYHAKRLLALHEGDMPYAIRILCNGVMETLGRLSRLHPRDRADEWRGNSFTAHPKVCGATGELLFFNYSAEHKPHVHAGIMDAHGLLKRTWDVEVEYPTMMHDMAGTRQYLVLLHLPLVFRFENIVKGSPLMFEKDKPARIGLLRRDQPSTAAGETASVQWFELPAFFAFHVANAYEDDKTGLVHIFACQFEEFNFAQVLDNDDWSEQHLQTLHEYVLDPSTGKATSREVSKVSGDFPVIHPKLSCLPNRYTWVATASLTRTLGYQMTGIAKIDLHSPKGQDGAVASIQLPEGCVGGEALFVPRDPNAPVKAGQGEDDGWLMLYVWYPQHLPGINGAKGDKRAEGVTKLHIYDAHTMSPTPVAVVVLPRRVPFGFHTTFVWEDQIANQLTWRA